MTFHPGKKEMNIKKLIMLAGVVVIFGFFMGMQERTHPMWFRTVLSTVAGICLMTGSLIDILLKTPNRKENIGILFFTCILYGVLMAMRFELDNWLNPLLAGCAGGVMALGFLYVIKTTTGSTPKG